MGSKKRSAWQKQKAEFAASLGGMDDLFTSENARSQRHDEERAAAFATRPASARTAMPAATRPNSPPPSAPNTAPRPCTSTAAPTATAGTSPQRGSNQTREHFWCSPQAFRIFRRVSQVSQSFATFAKGKEACFTAIPCFGQRGGLSAGRGGSWRRRWRRLPLLPGRGLR